MSRILVVEDSPAVRLLLIRRLEMAGHQVTATENGAQALTVLEGSDRPEKPEVILLDAMMPDADGTRVLEALDRALDETPVLMVSAIRDRDWAYRWKSVAGYVSKPIDFTDLLTRIDAITSGRSRP